ncbi:response regulator transcription factor [Lacisediminihabitans sp. H27-G8]|uniref:response regulator transcription factor n=1 Tax=Lacisediminihabitans sp. H27-G8 TaxID=3111909 RepID=UPI0038FBF90E
MTRLLIAEDEIRISGFVSRGLQSAGFACTVVADGSEALFHAKSGHFDLMLLDVGLPGMGGFEILRHIRLTDVSTPVVLLTARYAVDDIVRGLDGGATDYITKPFKFDEVLARVRLRLRERAPATPDELCRGELRLNPATRRAYVGQSQVELTAREFSLAQEFLLHPNQILSPRQLLAEVWDRAALSPQTVVAQTVAGLRSKIGGASIETVHGFGYRLK